MKKITAIIVSLMLIASSCIPSFAYSKAETPVAIQEGDKIPVVIIRGMEFTGLYLNYGTDNERNIMGDINIGSILSAIVKALGVKLFTGDREKATRYITDAALEILDGYSCNDDGSSKYNVGKERFPGAVSQYDDFDDVVDSELGITRTAKDTLGGDYVYYFNYDWRMNPLDIADEINETVERALEETGSDCVDIINCSMGGVMTIAYMTKYGYEKIHRCIFVSSTFCGTYATSDLLAGKVVINADWLTNYLLALNDNFAYKGLIYSLKYTGLIKGVASLATKFIENNKDRVFDEVMQPVFGNMLSLWALVLPENYEECKQYMFYRNGSDKTHAELIAKADELQAMMKNRDEMLYKAVSEGMEVCVVAGYNSPVAPAYERSYVNGDVALETPLMSGHATVAPFKQTLTDYDENSAHLSPDKVCDTSTALFPDNTWLLKDAPHVSGSYGTETAEFYMWLLTSDAPDIYKNAQYPAYMQSGSDMNLEPLR